MNLYEKSKGRFVDSKPFLLSPNSEVIYSYGDIDHLSSLVATVCIKAKPNIHDNNIAGYMM